MKKLVLTTVCALAVTGAAFAQGTVNWVALSPAAFTVQTNSTVYSPLFGDGLTGSGAVGGTAAAAGGFYYELLYNTAYNGVQVSGLSAPSNSFATLFGGTWLDAGLAATNTITSTGKAAGYPNNTQATIPWSNNVSNNIVLVGWSANLGTSWSVVSNKIANWNYSTANAFFGVSAAGFVTPFAPGINPGATIIAAGATAQGLPIFSLNTQLYLLPVPEPATFALIGLGGLSLLLFRRRQ